MAGGDGQSEPVILATAGYDHTIRFWQAHSGICHRTVQHPDSISFIEVFQQMPNNPINNLVSPASVSCEYKDDYCICYFSKNLLWSIEKENKYYDQLIYVLM